MVYSFGLDPFYSDTSNIYVSGNDVVKNFKLDDFDGDAITNGKLKLETGAFWKTTPDDVELLVVYEEGDQIFFEYRVTMRNKINIFTNVDLEDAVETDLNVVHEVIPVGYYRHKSLTDQTRVRWDSDLTWSHYDFGDVRSHNIANNLFSGDLKASFDINSSPLPDIFTDGEGRNVTKEFDYISVNAIYVSDSTHGKLSTDLPTIVGLTPAEYDLAERSNYNGAEQEGTMVHPESKKDYSNLWDPRVRLGTPFYEPIDPGIRPMSVGASLNPTTKSGALIWDPKMRSESMTDCQFTYQLGALSPLVYQYSSTMSYYKQTVVIQDYWAGFLVLGSYVVNDIDEIQSITRPVALHVTNRYIQAEITIVFKLFTSFTITPLEVDEPDLEEPEEYYDDLIWNAVVDGIGGGHIYTEGIEFGGLADLLMVAIILIALIAGIYIFVQYIIPLLMFRMGLKNR
jgi:hypothetical protein